MNVCHAAKNSKHLNIQSCHFFSIQMLFNFEFLSDILHMVSLTIDLSETCGSSQSFFQNINPTHKGNGIFGSGELKR